MNSYFKSLEAEQSRRIKQCGDNAYNSYISPNVIGTMFSQPIKIDLEELKNAYADIYAEYNSGEQRI